MLLDPFNRSRLPADFSREERVRLLAEFFQELMDGRMPRREVVLFAAGGGLTWLEQGGSLTRDYWRTAGPQGSTHTESVLYARCSSRRATDGRETDSITDFETPSLEQDE